MLLSQKGKSKSRIIDPLVFRSYLDMTILKLKHGASLQPNARQSVSQSMFGIFLRIQQGKEQALWTHEEGQFSSTK